MRLLADFAALRAAAILFAAAFSFPTFGFAQTKEEIIAEYRASVEADKAGDFRKSKLNAKSAFEKASALWGAGDKQTGILAANYGHALVRLKEWSEAATIFDQCDELLAAYEDAITARIDCIFMGGDVRRRDGKTDMAREKFRRAIDFGEGSTDPQILKIVGDSYLGFARSVAAPGNKNDPPRATIFSGETSSRIEGRMAENAAPVDLIEGYAQSAIDFYERAGAAESTDYAYALRLLGNTAEARQDFTRANDFYKRAADILAKLFGEEDTLTVKMRGRQKSTELEAYNSTTNVADLSPSREPSGPDCRIEFSDGVEMELCVKLRIKPYFPNSELFKNNQGFALIRYDINENGAVENASVVMDWPGGVFTERAMGSVVKWKYFPPKDMQGNVRRFNGAKTLIRFVIN